MKRFVLVAGLVIAAALLSVPGTTLYFEARGGANCASCHEMQPLYQTWHSSSHRAVSCGKCHGDALTLNASFHMTNVHRAYSHVRGDLPEQIAFGNEYVMAMNGQCRACHQQEYAKWQSGAHSAGFARIFLDRKHNTENMLMDDCLRCHGMFYERGVSDLVQPVSRTGPWRLADPALEKQPSMPCATCHQLHRQGEPMRKTAVDGRQAGKSQEIARPSLAFFDRRTQDYVPLADLPLPAMQDGTRAVKMSQDQRQALCYQCHAPTASMQAGTGDDRTGVGVHEGISCLGCHEQHGQKTRASCATCHPKMSNCGLDVEKMDTTFLSTESRHNIHRVKCVDCHPKGVPRKAVKTP
ncbi:MAG: multiheme c-type cytochrome [Candidatus Solibacter sp.]